MNMFNCYQAVGFYSILPFGMQWLYTNNHSGWSYVVGAVWFIGFIVLGVTVNNGLEN